MIKKLFSSVLLNFVVILLGFSLVIPCESLAQPDYWYDGQRRVLLHATKTGKTQVPDRGRRFQSAVDGPKRKNNGLFYVCYPSDWLDEQVLSLETTYNLKSISRFFVDPSVRIYRQPDAVQALVLANRIFEETDVDCASPLWQKQVEVKSLPASSDPLFSQQWYLDDAGQCGGSFGTDIDAPEAWGISSGAGVVIAIVDDGVQLDHPDLVDNLLDRGHFDFISNEENPDSAVHGTSVAGIAAGRGFNNIGIHGVAPSASLLSLRILSDTGQMASEWDVAAAENFSGATADIYNNSWGAPDGSFAAFEGPSMLTRRAMDDGVRKGRNGLGNIYVWAAGNGGPSEDANLDGYANSRHVIAVTSTTCVGMATSYAEPGSNILINAPSSDGRVGMVTTDKSGINGFNSGSNVWDLADIDYTNTFGGTSGSAAIVSGVAALMLSANDHLSWREVQQILAFSTEKNDNTDEQWRTNNAGFWINEKYGYGRVNAEKAVRMASDWSLPLAEEQSLSYRKSVNRTIPDNDLNGLSDSINVNGSLRVENVMITVDIPDHTYWGDLSMYLTSPQGTRTRLVQESFISENARTLGYNRWTFKNTLHLGELSMGPWTIEVIDNYYGDVGTLLSWSIDIFGTLVPVRSEYLPNACAAWSATRPSEVIAEALFMGVSLHGSSYRESVSGTVNEDYGVVASVRSDVAYSEHLIVALYDAPNGNQSWFSLGDNGWLEWDTQLATLQGRLPSPGQVKNIHAGKLSKGRYLLWNGFRDLQDEIYYCLEPIEIVVQ